jgi:hypothetical protein
MLILRSYLDETGSDDDPNVFICGFGGGLAEAGVWRKLEKKWKAVLDGYALPYFHATDFFSYRDLWKEGWKGNLPRCRELYRRLWDVIEKARIFPIGCLLPMERYRALLTVEKRKRLVGAYFVTFQATMGMVGTPLGDIHISQNISIITTVFDNKKGFGSAIESFFDYLTQQSSLLKRKLARPTQANWRQTIPLQVADIIAYESHREFRRRLNTPGNNKRYGWERLERLNSILPGPFQPLGDENSRIIFRPESFIEDLSRDLEDQFDETLAESMMT